MTQPSNPENQSTRRTLAVDMSPAAIDRRMREVAALWDAWRYLRNFHPVASPQEANAENVKVTSLVANS